MIELYFSKVKILAQRPTQISAVATVLLIAKTFTVKYYDRRLWRNIASIIIIRRRTHIKQDNDCNGNENKKAVLDRKSQEFY